MSLVCTKNDSDSHTGTVVGCDTRVIVGSSYATYVGASVTPDPKKGHSGKSITTCGCSGRTLVCGGTKKMVASGGSVSCGASVIASHTKATFLN